MPVFIKKLFRYTGFMLLGFIGFVLVYLSCAFCLSAITVNRANNSVPEVTMYILTNGVHTDIVVPVKNEIKDWRTTILFSNAHLPDTSNIHWLAMGWGDRGFYLETPQWADLTFSTAFKATFGLGKTAMHTTFYDALAEDVSCKKIQISKRQYIGLVTFIEAGFQKSESGNVKKIITSANYNNADAFYEANYHYSLFYTCNTWANSALKACGQKACLWTPFDKGIFNKYQQ